MEKMVKCKACGADIAKSAKACPKCGAKQKGGKGIWIAVAVIVVLLAAASAGGNRAEPKETGKPSQSQSQAKSPTVSGKDSPKESEKQEPSVPREYTNALKKAESYSKTMHMSKQGIYDQLTSEYGENFPAEAAQYAIDNLDVGYKENALLKAKSYYENMNMSKESVRNQLVSEYGEKFTEEEADYAIAHLDD